MKLHLKEIDETQFMVHPHSLNDEIVYLCQPQHIGCKWTQKNKHLRSSVWNSDGELISAGFPKFTNWGENSEHFPLPTSLKKAIIIEKIDGSLLCVSKYKGQYILRTRGTINAKHMENGFELEEFEKTYLPRLENICPNVATWNFTYLFEWVSPNNKIVLNYGKDPQWFLIGKINHDDYSLFSQSVLTNIAKEINCPRPPTYSLPSINELLEAIKNWKQKEGVVVYSNNEQTIHKVKSDWYLVRHRLKEELNNIEKVVDFFIQEGSPNYDDFCAKIAAIVDWETVQEIQGDISKTCEGWKNVKNIVQHMEEFTVPLKQLPRKEAAEKIISSYGQTNRASFCFKLLDNKQLDSKDFKKLLWQSLKN